MRLKLIRKYRRKIATIRRERRDFDLKMYDERNSLMTQQIGLVAMAWAGLEMSLDTSVELIHRNGGAGAVQPDLPASLKVKLEYLRKAPRKMPVIAHLSDEAINLSAKVQALKETRHDIIHGLVLLDPKGFDVFLVRYRYERSQLKIREAKMTQQAFNDVVQETMNVGQNSTALFGALARAFDDKKAIEVFRQISVRLAATAVEQKD